MFSILSVEQRQSMDKTCIEKASSFKGICVNTIIVDLFTMDNLINDQHRRFLLARM